MRLYRPALVVLALLLSACSKVSAPVAGDYRAYVTLRGGEAPFQLRITKGQGQTQVAVVLAGDAAPATEVQIKEGVLSAQLPLGLGTLEATLGRKALKGKVRITDIQGRSHALPFAAELGKTHRFEPEGQTDNADVSGEWQTELTGTGQFLPPAALHLVQSHDAVDGQWLLDASRIALVHGQVAGDAVSFSAFGPGVVLLFKGTVNDMGELQGELWSNLDAARPVVARRAIPGAANENVDLRAVALPWAVPTRELDQPMAQ